MEKVTVNKITFGDIDAVYILDEEGRVSFGLLPNSKSDNTVFGKGSMDPLIQISCTGDASTPGFAAGETRHNSALSMSLKYVSQNVHTDGNKKIVTTVVENADGLRAEHIIEHVEGSRCLCVFTKVQNNSNEDIMLEALSSFSITGITPYTDEAGIGRLFLHRFKSRWSAEGRHLEQSIEDLLLEPSWANFSVRCEKFGSIGSMPVKGYFPFVAVEDREANVVWGISNACSSSWQIEVTRINKNLSVTGGLADYEYGHWRKNIKPGEAFISPEAYISVTCGDVSNVCDRLLDMQRVRLTERQRQRVLPALFNEYCTTWGEPSDKNITEILSVIDGNDFEYFVIDAGWYASEVKGWSDTMGDWNVSKELFPNGIKSVVEKINHAGMKAGIWFELEVVGKDADALEEEAHLLTRDGKIIISGTRRFWDMRSDWVNEYLTRKVIDFIIENGFEYIKIDYNDTIGIGCDGDDSPGEGLRKCVEATKTFFRKIRECVPSIAIEICASGGHRLEPSFMELADYLSFSDAHEEKEIPVIALDLHNLVLPSKSQIWAVLRKDDELKRIVYSICAGMYGVLCISGDVFGLSDVQWKTARKGIEFYKKASPVISNGVTKKFGPRQNSNRDLRGYQASVRYSDNGMALVIVHSFNIDAEQKVSVLLEGEYIIDDIYETGSHEIEVINKEVKLIFKESYDAVAVLMRCSSNIDEKSNR